eukprot:537231-Amorphochlora_amoeboformis.AAC.1
MSSNVHAASSKTSTSTRKASILTQKASTSTRTAPTSTRDMSKPTQEASTLAVIPRSGDLGVWEGLQVSRGGRKRGYGTEGMGFVSSSEEEIVVKKRK